MVAQNAPAATAKAKPAYDPYKAVVGMFNGTLIRLGQVFKDPKNYAESTPYVVAECSKRYQDALDDCEIRILDAKWYLEQKLAENKRRREQVIEVRESSPTPATTKRKHDEAAEPSGEQQETSPKRTKPSGAPDKPDEESVASQSGVAEQPQPDEPSAQPLQAEAQTAVPVESKPQSPQKIDTQEQSKPSEPSEPNKPTQSQAQLNDSKPASSQPTPAGTADAQDFFESMFTEPPDDNVESEPNEEMNFDLLNSEFGESTTNNATQSLNQSQAPSQRPQAQPPPTTSQPDQASTNSSSLAGILPGLEQYANQPDSQNEQNPFTSAFEPNIFDSMLNDDAFEIDGAAVEQTDFSNIDVGNVEDLKDVNFDDIFGDGDGF